MAEMPSGTVTFLFTDLEGSTRLWDELPDAMGDALALHDELLQGAVAAHGGYLVKSTGDGVHAAFATAPDAIGAALDAQRALQRETWGETGELRVRIGLHTGAAEARDGDYYGTAVNRAARLMAVAHGRQIVCSQATADLARGELGEGTTLEDLGEHQLRDLGTPERVFQVTHPDLPSEFPALRTLDAFPGNLPLQVTEFVGRDDELVELAKLLGHSRLVTLTGTGGVGKTRLAIQAAAAALPHYPDGAWFVDLAPIDDETFVASAIASTMELPEHRQGNREEALVGALARRNALVVIDNCEHLVDTVAHVVDLVVHRCPGVRVIATSQEVLGVDGEAAFAVRPLAGDEATLLFVERAAAARHGFVLTGENVASVEELCRRLDGIPLAIELAAARVASMSPAAILERIDERFRLLGQGRRTARRRHQTLRAAVDWSYELLGPQEQVVFERLAVFAGEFTLEAAEAVIADDVIDGLDVLDLVAGLVAKSMVQLDERGGHDRYRLLETMRDYGLERLAARGDLDRFQARHTAYYVDFVEAAAPHFVGPDDAEWFNRVEEEYPNIRAALLFTQEHEPLSFVRMVLAIAEFWSIAYRAREGLAWITAAHDVAPDTPGRAAAEALALGGVLAFNLARWEQGFALVQHSFDRSAADGEQPRAQAFSALALAALVQDRPEDARRFGDEAVAVARARGDRFELVRALAFAGTQCSLTGADAVGTAYADEGVQAARALGNSYLLAFATMQAGITRYRSEPARAIALIQAACDLPSARDSAGTATARFIKAMAHLSIRDERGAASELLDALPLQQAVGEEYYLAMSLAGAAVLLRRHGQPEVAVRILALNERLRDDGRIVGATRDLESQAQLRARLEHELEPEAFAALWSEGRAMSLDDAVTVALELLAPIAESG